MCSAMSERKKKELFVKEKNSMLLIAAKTDI